MGLFNAGEEFNKFVQESKPSIDDPFEAMRSYLTTELCGYDYALEEHNRRLELGMGNKVQYIKGRIDAINAALEVAKTFER